MRSRHQACLSCVCTRAIWIMCFVSLCSARLMVVIDGVLFVIVALRPSHLLVRIDGFLRKQAIPTAVFVTWPGIKNPRTGDEPKSPNIEGTLLHERDWLAMRGVARCVLKILPIPFILRKAQKEKEDPGKAMTAVQDYGLNLDDAFLPDATLCRDPCDSFICNGPTVKVQRLPKVLREALCSHRKPGRHSARTEAAHLFKLVLFIFALCRAQQEVIFRKPNCWVYRAHMVGVPSSDRLRVSPCHLLEDSCMVQPSSSLRSLERRLRVPQLEVQKHVRSTAATKHKTNGCAWFLRNLVTHLAWLRTGHRAGT